MSRGDTQPAPLLRLFSDVLFLTPLIPPHHPTPHPPHLSALCSSLPSLAGEADLRAEEFLQCGGSQSEHRVLLLPGRHLEQRHRSFHQRTGAEDVTSQYVSAPPGSRSVPAHTSSDHTKLGLHCVFFFSIFVQKNVLELFCPLNALTHSS